MTTGRTINVTITAPTINVTEEKKTVNVYPFDSGSRAILKSLGEAKGDLAAWTASGAVDNLPVGSDGQVLTAASGESMGVGWADAPGGVIPLINDYRLTLESGVPVSTSDQTAKTSVYMTPGGKGNRFAIYDGGWELDQPDEIEIKVTDTQTGNTTNGTKVIMGLSDTSQLIAGMEVSGTGIGGSAVISTVDSATQVTLDTNSTADGTGVSITFKIPASSCLDLFAIPSGGSTELRWGPLWSNSGAGTSARATALTTQNGVNVLTGSTSWRYLGTLRTTSTAGQLEDSLLRRLVWNYYNRAMREFSLNEATVSWSYNSSTIRQMNGATANKFELVVGLNEDAVYVFNGVSVTAASGEDATSAWGLDSTSSISTYSSRDWVRHDFGYQGMTAEFAGKVGIGYHYLAPLESGNAGSPTFYGGPYQHAGGFMYG